MYAKKKSVSMKALVLLLAVVLLIGCVAGGTLAYLMAKSATVTNTFVAGEIGTLTLTETFNKDTDNNDKADAWEKIIVPGVDLEKDPTVTFSGNNVAAYVFLKVDADGWHVTDPAEGSTTYTYSIGTDEGTGENIVHKEMKWTLTGWTKLQDGIYYKAVAANETTAPWHIIDDDKIYVESGITKNDLGENSKYVKSLTFTAYAIQQDTFEDDAEGTENGKTAVQKAWDVAKTVTN